jgi:hypothetical protein
VDVVADQEFVVLNFATLKPCFADGLGTDFLAEDLAAHEILAE